MDSLVITPKDKEELKLLKTLLKRLNVNLKILTESEKEDIGLYILMEKADAENKTSLLKFKKKLAQ